MRTKLALDLAGLGKGMVDSYGRCANNKAWSVDEQSSKQGLGSLPRLAFASAFTRTEGPCGGATHCTCG